MRRTSPAIRRGGMLRRGLTVTKQGSIRRGKGASCSSAPVSFYPGKASKLAVDRSQMGAGQSTLIRLLGGGGGSYPPAARIEQTCHFSPPGRSVLTGAFQGHPFDWKTTNRRFHRAQSTKQGRSNRIKDYVEDFCRRSVPVKFLSDRVKNLFRWGCEPGSHFCAAGSFGHRF